MVSQYIEGTNLRAQIVTRRYSPTEAADFVATIAGALHYAHKQGVVHRDIKPENILVDGTGKPYVADFGIALRDDDFGRGGENRLIGTPSYMSPEQSRGEGHLVDGRSDVFSLGIVLYELLTGVNPFRGANWADSVFKIAKIEVKPPRQINDALPRELERVCLRALAKRATDRYTTAKDFAVDLRHFLADRPATDTKTAIVSIAGSVTQPDIRTPSSDSRTLKMVPKGLRSFDAQDADFFLELLPGPRDRDGLPDSIRFWKMRLEETDSDETFRVGLIYGPSGCGKSSLVKAGLLPRLAEHVLPIYIEATADETESRLLHGLLKRCPGLPPNPDLKTALAALRHGEGLPAGWKVLVILDQFEQWLHSKGKDHNTELIQALRQCDGGRVQCVAMVRDDFWMAVTHFLANLEVDLVQGRNFAAVDLFDLDHAHRVLTACGRAFGRLPDRSAENSDEQHAFLAQAVSGLAEEEKVVCVRLALFAEMMKSRPWTPAALKQVGGTEGVGVTFLEETFSVPSANPKHRLHQTAARAVLAALLPESGSEIKGNMRSRAELLEISGLSSRPKEFADLIRILDGEIRLITPTDPEGIDPDKSLSEVEAARKYYQLTHDFLVPALREWLTRKQRETRRGRAELRLAERAATWKEKRENRHLPSLWEYANIRLLTNARNWKEPERKMMQRAGRVHGLRTAIVASVLLAVAVCGAAVSRHIEEKRQADFAAALVRRLIDADIAQVPAIVREIDGYRRWTDPLLRQEQSNAPPGSDKKLHVNLALLPVDRSKVSELESDLLSVPPGTFVVVRDSLSSEKDQVVESLWRIALDARQESRPRFQAAAALASYASDDKRWSSIGPFVAGRLVAFEASPLVAWREALRPAKEQLLASLAAIFRDPRQDEQARRFAAETLADYAPDRPDRLFDLLADAEVFQFPVLFEALAKPGQRDKAVQLAEARTPATLAGQGHGRREGTRGEASDECRRRALAHGHRQYRLAAAQGRARSAATKLLHQSPRLAWRRACAAHPTTRRRTGCDNPPSAGARDRRVPRNALFDHATTTPDREALHSFRERTGRRFARRGGVAAAEMGSGQTARRRTRQTQERREATAEPQIARRAALVREHVEADFRDRGRGRVRDGIARIGAGTARQRRTAPCAHRTPVCHRRPRSLATGIRGDSAKPFRPRADECRQMGQDRRFPRGGHDLVRSGGVLQLAQRAGGNSQGPVVLRTKRRRQISRRHESQTEVLGVDRLSAADRGRVGIRQSRGNGDGPLFRPERRPLAQLRLVLEHQPTAHLARGQLATQRFGLIRHAGKRDGMVLRGICPLPTGAGPHRRRRAGSQTRRRPKPPHLTRRLLQRPRLDQPLRAAEFQSAGQPFQLLRLSRRPNLSLSPRCPLRGRRNQAKGSNTRTPAF